MRDDRMGLVVFSGTANPGLGARIASELGAPLGVSKVGRFPDGEIDVELATDVGGREVLIVQPTAPVVSASLFELLLMADACRRGGAARITAVVPYFGYARADRRTREGQPLASRVVADILATVGISCVVTVDLHTAALEGSFSMPLVHVSALPLLLQAARAHVDDRSVVVSPDLGAVKLAQRFSRRLGVPLAIVHKSRISGDEVRVHGLVGSVEGMRPLIVDDMISTGGTIAAAAAIVLDHGALPEITVVATHGLLVERASARLQTLPLERLITTDSLVPPSDLPFPHDVVGLGPLSGEVLSRMRRGASLVVLGLWD